MLTVLNIEDHEILPHSLCFLRISSSNKTLSEGFIENCGNGHNNKTIWPITDGCLNAFISLIRGENKLTIKVGSEEIKKTLYFVESTNPRYLRLIYVTCLNEENFQSPSGIDCSPNAAIKKIQTGSLLLQTFLSESLYLEGFHRCCFRLELDANLNPKVFTIQLPCTLKDAQKLSAEKLWELVALQILSSSLSNSKYKYLAFFCGTRYHNPSGYIPLNEKDVISMTKGHISLGGGGLALVSSGALYSWASSIPDIYSSLRNTQRVNTQTLMDFSAGRGTWGACYGAHIGSVLHEVGHTLDLGHTSYGIMSRGFEDFNLFFTDTSMNYYSNKFCNNNSNSHHSSSCSLIKESVTFTTDFIPQSPYDNIKITVEPPKLPISSSVVYSPPANLYSNQLLNCQPKQLLCKDIKESGEDVCEEKQEKNGNNCNLNFDKQINCRAFWTRSNAAILAYHKWLNNFPDGEKPELKGSVLRGTVGIKVVELRNLNTVAFHHWEFISRAPPVLHIPWAKVSHWPSDSHIEVVAEDEHGNLLKGCFVPRPL